ncbi:MAG: hypothetical protein ACFCBW_14830, partial [Candidatus Competibacterales bacterium]
QLIKRDAYYNIPPKVRTELMMANAERRAEGKPPMDLSELTADMEALRAEELDPEALRDKYGIPGLFSDDKVVEMVRERRIEELREKYGLSEDTMRELATQRLGQVYGEGAAQAGAIAQQQLEELTAAYDQIVAQEGVDSPRAQELQAQIQELEEVSAPYVEELEGFSEQLMDLYPVPKGFWETLGDIMLGVLQFVGPMLLNLIPGVGSALYAGYQGVRAAISFAQGDILGGLTSTVGALVPGAGAIGGAVGGSVGQAITAIAGTVGQVAKTGLGVGRGIEAMANGDILGGFTQLAGAGLGGAGAAGVDANTLGTLQQGFNVATGATRAAVGLANGQPEQILAGLGSFAGGIRDAAGDALGEAGVQTLNFLQDGARFGGSLASGNFAAALDQLGQGLGNTALGGVLNDPLVGQVTQWARQGADFAQDLTRGDFAGALGHLNQGLQGLPGLGGDQQALVDQARHWSQAGTELAQGLVDGRYGQALDTLTRELTPFMTQEMEGGLRAFHHLMGAGEAVAHNDALGLQRQFGRGVDELGPLFSHVADGQLRQTFDALAAGAQGLLDNPQVTQAWQTLAAGAPFVQALTQGEVSRAFQGLEQQLANPPEALGLAQSLVQRAEAAVRPLANGQAVAALEHLQQLDTSPDGTAGLFEATPAVQEASAFFNAMAGGLFTPQGLLPSLDQFVQGYTVLSAQLQQLEALAQEMLTNADGRPERVMPQVARQAREQLMPPPVIRG